MPNRLPPEFGTGSNRATDPAQGLRGSGLVFLVLGLILLWQMRHVLLLVFGAVLLALALDAASRALSRRCFLSERAALAGLVLGLLLLLVLGSWLGGGLIGAQLASLGESLPQALSALGRWLSRSGWGRWLLQLWQGVQLDPQEMSRLASLAGSTVNAGIVALGALMLTAALAVYLAAEPALYLRGFLRLLPPARRPEAEASLRACGRRLLYWLLGQGVTMLLVALLTGVGLGLIGMPLALTLAVIAGLLEFVPYFGTAASSLLIVLVAFTQGERMAFYAALVCGAVQLIEAYALQPLVQRWSVRLPPALSLLAVLAFGLLFQIPGLLLAMPLMVLLTTLVGRLWMEREADAPLPQSARLEIAAADAVEADAAQAYSGSGSATP